MDLTSPEHRVRLLQAKWQSDPSKCPFQLEMERLEGYALHHDRMYQPSIAAAFRESIAGFMAAQQAILTAELTYEAAARLSLYGSGTLKNQKTKRKGEGMSHAARGHIQIQNIPLRPGPTPLQAMMASELRASPPPTLEEEVTPEPKQDGGFNPLDMVGLVSRAS